MPEYNYAELVEYIRTTTDRSCKVSIKNFAEVICKLTQLRAYSEFKELVDVWVSANQRHRPDLEPEVAEKKSLESLAAITVLADHGTDIKVATNPLNYFNERNLGSAMKYLEDYLHDRGQSMFTLSISMN